MTTYGKNVDWSNDGGVTWHRIEDGPPKPWRDDTLVRLRQNLTPDAIAGWWTGDPRPAASPEIPEPREEPSAVADSISITEQEPDRS